MDTDNAPDTAANQSTFVKQFFLFSAISCVVFLIVAGSIMIPKVQSTYATFLTLSHTQALNSARQSLESYLDTRVSILQEIAALQSIKEAASSNDVASATAIETLKSAKIIGQTPPLSLFNSTGTLLFSSHLLNADMATKTQNIAARLLQEGSSQVGIEFINEDDVASVLIAVPVLFGAAAKGVLIAAFPLDLDATAIKEYPGVPFALKATKGASVASNGVGQITAPNSQTTLIQPYGINLEILYNQASIDAKKNDLVLRNGFSIVVVATITFGLIIVAGFRLVYIPSMKLIVAGKKISRQERELQMIFDNVPFRIWYKDDKNKILRLNKAAAKSMGRTVAETEGQDTYKLFPEMAKKYHEDDLAVINSGQARLGIVEEYTPSDGERGWVRTDKIPFTDEKKGDRGVFVVARDITELIAAQEDLRASEERFALSAVGSSVGIWDWIDINESEEYWSPQFFKLLGYAENEIAPSLDAFQKLLHPDDVEKTFAAVDAHFTEKTPFDIEYRLQHKNGQYRWFRGTGQASWDADKKPVRMVGSIQDIDNRVKDQLKLKEYSEELARSNADLEQFAYVASHDLKAPLRGILNLAEWIEENIKQTADEETRSYLRLMKSRVSRLESLLAGLLTYSRVGAGINTLKPVNLNTVIGQIVDILDGERLGFQFEYGLPTILGKESEISQVFLNLIGNAIKHNIHNPGRIEIGHKIENNYHIFHVTDHGIGIPPELWNKVFEMFQTLKPRDQVEGSGMGLAIVKKLITRRGGAIWLEQPSTGKGLVVGFSLPVLTNPKQQDNNQ